MTSPAAPRRPYTPPAVVFEFASPALVNVGNILQACDEQIAHFQRMRDAHWDNVQILATLQRRHSKKAMTP